jgi:hypothetical protein
LGTLAQTNGSYAFLSGQRYAQEEADLILVDAYRRAADHGRLLVIDDTA